MHSATILILLAVGLLLILTLMRGWLAFRLPASEALTIEEGLEALRRRVTGVDHLRISLAVLTTLAVALPLAMASTATFADLFLVLTGLLTFTAMLIPWFRRKNTARIARTLGASDRIHEGDAGSFPCLLRTYFYYRNSPGLRPDLFDYTRRQLAVRILGIDLRAHAPLSTRIIASTTAKLSGLMALFALLAGLLTWPGTGASAGMARQTSPALETMAAQNQIDSPTHQTGKASNVPATSLTDTAFGESPETAEAAGNPESARKGSAAEPSSSAGTSTQSLEGDKDEDQNSLASDAGSAPEPSPGQEEKTAGGLLGSLLQSLQALLGGEQKAQRPAERMTSIGEKSGGAGGQKNGMSASLGASGQARETQAKPGSGIGVNPSDRPFGSGEAQNTPPSDEGEGATGQSRLSSGAGPELFGKASRRPDVPGVDARSLRLTVDQEVQRGKPQESGSFSLPKRFNPVKPLSPDDVAISPADPFINQRVPAEYRQALKKILAKP